VIEEARKYLTTQAYWERLHGAAADEAILYALADLSRTMVLHRSGCPGIPRRTH